MKTSFVKAINDVRYGLTKSIYFSRFKVLNEEDGYIRISLEKKYCIDSEVLFKMNSGIIREGMSFWVDKKDFKPCKKWRLDAINDYKTRTKQSQCR